MAGPSRSSSFAYETSECRLIVHGTAGEERAATSVRFLYDGNRKPIGFRGTPHHFASAFPCHRDLDRGGREVTGWPVDAAVAVDAKTRPRRLGHAADDVPTATTGRFVIGLADVGNVDRERVSRRSHGDISCTVRVEAGAVAEHGAGDVEQAVGVRLHLAEPVAVVRVALSVIPCPCAPPPCSVRCGRFSARRRLVRQGAGGGRCGPGSGSPRQRRLFALKAGQLSGWPATVFPHGRPRLSSEGPQRQRRTRASGLTAVVDRALPDAGDRPALMLLPARAPATGASTAGRNRRGVAPHLRAGVEGAVPGRRPPPAPCVAQGVCCS